MFSAARTAALDEIEWDAKQLEYIETWNFSDPVATDKAQVQRDGEIPAGQCKDWLYHRGRFAVPLEVTAQADRVNGGLRLLICDRTSLFPVGVGMTRDDFTAAEKVLKLHTATLPSFLVGNGTHSRYLTKDENDSLRKIDVILKAPQKYEIANYGLSVSSDVKTGWTTALLYGESVTRGAWRAIGRNAEVALLKKSSWEYKSPVERILELLRTSMLPWNHPLLLPCTLVADHLASMKAFCEGELTKDCMEIERKLGVVQVGSRSVYGMDGLNPHFRPPQEEADWTNALLDQPMIMNSMTVRINTQYTKVIFTKRSPNWSLEASDFLLNLWRAQLKQAYPSATHDEFLIESLEYNKDVATSVQNHVDNLQTRMDLQLNILYNFVAQRDNRLNTRIARTSGRDSVSMKILAFISAVFLPPTYIATLFSMQGLFNWEPDASDRGEKVDVVNDKFWIYWAITVPLTVLTIIGWAVWWKYEMKRYPSEPGDDTASSGSFTTQIMETLGWTVNDAPQPPPPKKIHDPWVFGGRRKHSKLGIDGNRLAESDKLGAAEAGAVRSTVISSKSTPTH